VAYTWSATSDRLTNAGVGVNAAPLTFSCWFNPTSFASAQVLLNLHDTATAGEIFRLTVLNTGVLRAGVFVSGVLTGNANSAASANVTAWNHCGCVFSSTTARHTYLNGTKGTVDTTSATPSGTLDEFRIGQTQTGSNGIIANSVVAEVGVWNAALLDDEMVALSKGFSPLLIARANLVFYRPLIRDLNSHHVGLNLATTGSPTVSVHPPIIQPF